MRYEFVHKALKICSSLPSFVIMMLKKKKKKILNQKDGTKFSSPITCIKQFPLV